MSILGFAGVNESFQCLARLAVLPGRAEFIEKARPFPDILYLLARLAVFFFHPDADVKFD